MKTIIIKLSLLLSLVLMITSCNLKDKVRMERKEKGLMEVGPYFKFYVKNTYDMPISYLRELQNMSITESQKHADSMIYYMKKFNALYIKLNTNLDKYKYDIEGDKRYAGSDAFYKDVKKLIEYGTGYTRNRCAVLDYYRLLNESRKEFILIHEEGIENEHYRKAINPVYFYLANFDIDWDDKVELQSNYYEGFNAMSDYNSDQLEEMTNKMIRQTDHYNNQDNPNKPRLVKVEYDRRFMDPWVENDTNLPNRIK